MRTVFQTFGIRKTFRYFLEGFLELPRGYALYNHRFWINEVNNTVMFQLFIEHEYMETWHREFKIDKIFDYFLNSLELPENQALYDYKFWINQIEGNIMFWLSIEDDLLMPKKPQVITGPPPPL